MPRLRVVAGLLHFIESALGWLEPTPWGAPAISAFLGSIVTIWGWISNQPLVVTFVLASLSIQAWFYILRWGLPALGRQLAPNLIIEIPIASEVPDDNGKRSVGFNIRIVNASPTHRVGLDFVYVEDVTEPTLYRFHTVNVGHDLTTNLAPEEETAG